MKHDIRLGLKLLFHDNDKRVVFYKMVFTIQAPSGTGGHPVPRLTLLHGAKKRNSAPQSVEFWG